MKKWYDEEYEFTVEVTGFLKGDHTESRYYYRIKDMKGEGLDG